VTIEFVTLAFTAMAVIVSLKLTTEVSIRKIIKSGFKNLGRNISESFGQGIHRHQPATTNAPDQQARPAAQGQQPRQAASAQQAAQGQQRGRQPGGPYYQPVPSQPPGLRRDNRSQERRTKPRLLYRAHKGQCRLLFKHLQDRRRRSRRHRLRLARGNPPVWNRLGSGREGIGGITSLIPR